MNLKELKESLLERINPLLEKISESSLFLKIKERYDNLSPRKQKWTQRLALVFFVIVLILWPFGHLELASEYLDEYLETRDTISQLFKAIRESGSSPRLAPQPHSTELKSRIESELKNLRLLPEQIAGVTEDSAGSVLVPKNFQDYSLSVQLRRLNLRQSVDVASKLSNINPAVKLEDLSIQAEKDGYFDMVLKFVALNIPGGGGDEEDEDPPTEKTTPDKTPPSKKPPPSKGAK